MSINSLTAVASGGITDSTSAFFYCVEKLNSKRATLGDMVDLGLAGIGALVSASADMGYSAGTIDPVSWSAAEYDFGGWWNASSSSMFVVPNDHWSHVVVGFGLRMDNAAVCDVRLLVNSNYAYGSPFIRSHNTTAGQLAGFSAVSAPLPVNSGDTIELAYSSTLANTIQALTTTNFWIMPWKARV